MSLTNSTKLVGTPYMQVVPADEEVDATEGTMEAIGLTDNTTWESGDFVYSASAEYPAGFQEPVNTVGGILQDVEDEPGVIYSGPSGAAFRVSINEAGIQCEDGDSSTEGDTVCLVLCKNGQIIQYAEEGFIDVAEAAAQFTGIDTYVTLNEGDVLQLALAGTEGNTDEDWEIGAGALFIA